MAPDEGRPRPAFFRSVILAHGYHVEAQQWRDVVWSDQGSGRLGRVPRAVLIALSQPDPLLLFGTGAAAHDGATEYEYTLRYARTHRSDLYDLVSRSFDVSREHSRRLVNDLLDERSHCDRTSTTTQTEAAAALDTAVQCEAAQLTLVSSPTHIARCLQTALTLLAITPHYAPLAGHVSAVASDTTVTGRGPGDVVVLEPQTHRPDAEGLDFADVARAALPLMGHPSAAGYLHEWLDLTQTWLAQIREES